jgi:hypothetical protein
MAVENDSYDAYLAESRAHPIPVFSAQTSNGVNVALVPKMNVMFVNQMGSPFKKLHKLIMPEWGCLHCASRLKSLRLFADANGEPVFCNLKDPMRTERQAKINATCDRLIAAYTKLYPDKWTLEIVTEDTFYSPYEGESPEGRPYAHYSYVPSSTTGYLSEVEKNLLVKAIHKYVPLISALLDKVGLMTHIRDSCKELRTLLLKSRYGKTVVPALNWFMSLLDKVTWTDWESTPWNERLRILGEVICCSSIKEGDSKSAHIGFYQTVNGFIMDIFENGHTPEGVVRLIEERLSPDKYRRKTADPKEAHIKAAEEFCRNIVNTIETTNQLECHPGCVRIQAKPVTAQDAFAQMRSPSSNKYGGFAQKMRKHSTAQTITEVIADIESGLITGVEMVCDEMEVVYTAHTTLKESDLSVNTKHLWCFLGRNSGYTRFRGGMKKVTHIYQFKTGRFNNILFIIDGARDTLDANPITKNCCFPELLAPKHRSAERAFEKLNSLLPVQIPDTKEALSIGVGSSVGFEDGRLTTPITLRLISNNPIKTVSTVRITHV